jgi:FKBP-type peptidyl-prolyl cis-trans isomerase FklB
MRKRAAGLRHDASWAEWLHNQSPRAELRDASSSARCSQGRMCSAVRPCNNVWMRKLSLNALLLLLAALFSTRASAQNATPAQSAPPSSDAKSQQAAPASAAKSPLPTPRDKNSYAIGLNVGKGLHQDSIDVDPNLILQGLKDGLSGGQSLMTDEELQTTMLGLQNEVRGKMEAKRQQAGGENKKTGDAYLAANKAKPGVTTLPSGLQYKVLKQGTGPKPTANDTVVCNYKGTLIDGKEFDSSYKRGEPAKFPVRGVIKGWTEALQLMPVGSKWELVLPPDLAYGERGAGADIGPNATLVFEVELLSIEPPQAQQPAQPETHQH